MDLLFSAIKDANSGIIENMDNKLEEIKKLISRYRFIDRIALIEYLSFISICPLHEVIEKKKGQGNYVFPWDAETIATIALCFPHVSKNSNQVSFYSKCSSNYIKRMLCLLDESGVPEISKEMLDKYGYESIIRVLVSQQEKYQESALIKAYRYNYLFSYNIETKRLLCCKSGTEDYMVFAVLAVLPETLKKAIKNEEEMFGFYCFQKWIKHFLSCAIDHLSLLSISLEDYIKQQNEKINKQTLNEIMNSYKVMYEKPLLFYNNEMIVLSHHCLDYACTDGLFINTTFKESDVIKQTFSRALEDYLYKIADEGALYETVPIELRRKKYGPKKRRHDPEDVVIKNANTIIMFESKTFIHQRKFWINDLDAVNAEYKKAIEGTKELLKSYHNFISGSYKPFGTDDRDKKVFLVLVMLTYINLDYELIIKEVIKEKEFANDYQVLKDSLVITNLYSIEVYFLYKKDIVKDLIDLYQRHKLYEFGSKRTKCLPIERIKSFDMFVKEIVDRALSQIK